MTNDAKYRFQAALLGLRADSQSLLESIVRLERAGELIDPESRRSSINTELVRASNVFVERNLTDFTLRIREALDNDSSLASDLEDEGQYVMNAVEDLQREWPIANATVDSTLAQAKEARAILEGLIAASARRTIPDRLCDHLKVRRTGRAVDFNAVFRDELPDDGQRQRLLEEIKEYEGQKFSGVVDVKKGLVYVTSSNKLWRRLSIAAPVITAAGIGALFFLVGLLKITWPLAGNSALLGYFYVLMGMILHLVIENAKMLDMAGEIVVVGDKLTWLHLHWIGVTSGLLPAIVTVVGLRYLEPKSVDFLTYLFAGYSVDSIAGLFITRYDSAAKKGIDALTKRIKATP